MSLKIPENKILVTVNGRTMLVDRESMPNNATPLNITTSNTLANDSAVSIKKDNKALPNIPEPLQPKSKANYLNKTKKKVLTPIHKPGKMNKTEASWAKILDYYVSTGDIVKYLFERVRLIIGDERCTYTPDFMVLFSDGSIAFHEIKGGHYYDDARVKFQAAKLMYDMFSFHWVQLKNKQWSVDNMPLSEIKNF